MATVIANKVNDKNHKVEPNIGNKDSKVATDPAFPTGQPSKLEMYRLLVDELIQDEPNKLKVRDYCNFLKIPYSLNSTTQLGTVFNRLQSLNRHAINK